MVRYGDIDLPWRGLSAMRKLVSFVLVAFTIYALCVIVLQLDQPDPDEGVNVKAEMNDPELGSGPVSMSQHGEFTGPRDGERGHFIAQYSVVVSKGNKVVKTIFANAVPYQTRGGHFVLYSYYREDGTLDYDKLVEPEPALGASVMVKLRLRIFDARGKQTEERYIREDGSLGALIDLTTGSYKQFQADGKTLRYEQIPLGKDDLKLVWYKRDGKTVWYETSADGRTHVYFDLDGKPVDKEFSGEAAGTNGFSMGSGEAPKEHTYINFWRKDGTLEYKQTWFTMFDPGNDKFVEVIGKLVIFDASGKNPLQEYTLELRRQGEQRFIKQVVIHNSDGTTLVRKYRAPGNRLSEDIVNVAGQSLSHHEFDATDRFQESLPDNLFHGFGLDIWGSYDDDTHLID